ncbi:hypothetical protein CMEL01_14586 [Colletotrichum melonis]|uniref:Uncharacterized protein n=1 Tax=Colletotrichum melonis TaxID=1209925 RepID=A0AAI9URN7_9PEZI|nr:hypothetical protein CMEL01_14586 [Colletotrichum melonis]
MGLTTRPSWTWHNACRALFFPFVKSTRGLFPALVQLGMGLWTSWPPVFPGDNIW